ncbi:MAG: hypothetical protein QNJ36_03745 [Calothrix sp. MO_167.B42]|nr:hypothetical protein [Calothrix sp. MO_167.B42]
MDKKQKIMNSAAISRLIGVRYVYLGLGTTLATSLIPFTTISPKPVFATQMQLNASHQVKKDSVTANIEPEMDTGLRQKLIAYKNRKNHLVNTNTHGIEDSKYFTTHSNRLQSNKSDLNADLINVLRAYRKNRLAVKSDLNTDITKNLLIKKNQSRVIAQNDPSEGLGDTLQNLDRLRRELLITPITIPGEPPSSAPASTAGTPTAYGANWRQAFIGGGLNFPLEDGRTDGALGVGFGLGDSVKSVGLEITASISSVDTGDFGDSGGLGFKVHKSFPDGLAVAAGWSNVVKWGDSDGEEDTIYGVVTKAFQLQPNNPQNQLPLTVSVGIGSGGFRSTGAIEDGNNTPNFFGGLGLRVAPQVSLVTSWTGSRLNVGGSFAPLKEVPVVINAFFTDVTSNFDDGLGFNLSAGYAFQF